MPACTCRIRHLPQISAEKSHTPSCLCFYCEPQDSLWSVRFSKLAQIHPPLLPHTDKIKNTQQLHRLLWTNAQRATLGYLGRNPKTYSVRFSCRDNLVVDENDKTKNGNNAKTKQLPVSTTELHNGRVRRRGGRLPGRRRRASLPLRHRGQHHAVRHAGVRGARRQSWRNLWRIRVLYGAYANSCTLRCGWEFVYSTVCMGIRVLYGVCGNSCTLRCVCEFVYSTVCMVPANCGGWGGTFRFCPFSQN